MRTLLSGVLFAIAVATPVLDRDYLTVPADEINSIRPVATLIGGSVVHGSL